MITLTCTHCKAVLNIDDAFAGGVCRCQHCGTIQTVPTKDKAAVGSAGRSLYKGKAAGDTRAGSGIDQLADVVASSGLSSGLRNQQRAAASTPAKPVIDRRLLVLAGAAVVIIAVLVGIILMLASGGRGSQNGGGSAGGASSGGSANPAASGPALAGVAIPETSVVYVIDRGSATAEIFDLLRQAVVKSARSLGPDRQFLVIFWDNGDGVVRAPQTQLTPANEDNVNKLEQAFDSISPYGQTTLAPALKLALAENPGAIVIITAKAWQLPDSELEQFKSARGQSKARVYALSVGSADGSAVFPKLAELTGGVFKELSRGDLRVE